MSIPTGFLALVAAGRATISATVARIVSPNQFNAFEVSDAGMVLAQAFGYVDIVGGDGIGITLNTTETVAIGGCIHRRALNGTIYSRNAIATLTTAADAQVPLATFATTANRIYTVRVRATVAENVTDEGGSFRERRAAFRNVAGVLTQIGTTQLENGTDLLDASLATATLVLDVNGTTIRVLFDPNTADSCTARAIIDIDETALT